MKQNCWEYKNCGRQPGGSKINELGVCPASTENKLDGLNSGSNSGRACWVVSGTFCKGEIQGTFALKARNCLECDFYRAVVKEEGSNFTATPMLYDKLDSKSAMPERRSI